MHDHHTTKVITLFVVSFYKRLLLYQVSTPVGIYLLKVNNRNTRARCEICSKLTIKTPERCHWRVNTDWDLIHIELKIRWGDNVYRAVSITGWRPKKEILAKTYATNFLVTVLPFNTKNTLSLFKDSEI